jgi:hypothetical protein
MYKSHYQAIMTFIVAICTGILVVSNTTPALAATNMRTNQAINICSALLITLHGTDKPTTNCLQSTHITPSNNSMKPLVDEGMCTSSDMQTWVNINYQTDTQNGQTMAEACFYGTGSADLSSWWWCQGCDRLDNSISSYKSGSANGVWHTSDGRVLGFIGNESCPDLRYTAVGNYNDKFKTIEVDFIQPSQLHNC